MIKIILTISILINILLITKFVLTNNSVPKLTSWDIINQKATIKFYYDAYHKNIPPGFINATRMNSFKFWLNNECTIDLNSLPPKYTSWCNNLKLKEK
jgi:hypothetical protein